VDRSDIASSALVHRPRWVRAVQVAGAIALLATGGFLYYRLAPRHVPQGQPPLTHLSAGTLGDLRAAFNAAPDRTRLLLLLSPT
jgi:hypothetical protein